MVSYYYQIPVGDIMKKIKLRSPIGLRTVKTALAVVISMLVVDFFGTTSSKLIFAMLGALAAVQPTFNESLESCLTQIIGVFLGALAGGLLVITGLPPIIAAGIGIIFVISLYNGFKIRYSAGLACIIVVSICIDGETKPFTYAMTRIWDTAIGLAIGTYLNWLLVAGRLRKFSQAANDFSHNSLRLCFIRSGFASVVIPVNSYTCNF